MASPSVSVVVPVCNRVEFLAEALDSIQRQRYAGPIEVVVVDDGSTIPVAEQFAARFPTVRFLRQPNLGVGSARQAGALATTGELLAHLDDDDVWPPDSLQRRVDVLLARPDVHVVAGDIAHLWPDRLSGEGFYRHRFPRLDHAPRQPVEGSGDTWVFERGTLVDAFLLGLPFFAQTILARRDWFHAIGGWEAQSTIFTECYGFCYRATLAGPIGWVDAPVAHVRRGHQQATGDVMHGRFQESLGLADWGNRLTGADRDRVVPRLARRLLARAAMFARAGRMRQALAITGLGLRMVARAPAAFVARPWRAPHPVTVHHASR